MNADYERGFNAALELVKLSQETYEESVARWERERLAREEHCKQTTEHGQRTSVFVAGERRRVSCDYCGADLSEEFDK